LDEKEEFDRRVDEALSDDETIDLDEWIADGE